MKKFIIILTFLLVATNSMAEQINFKTYAEAYDVSTGDTKRLGVQYVSANIQNGSGTMTIGSLMLIVKITETMRDEHFKLTAYALTMRTTDGKYLTAALTIHDRGTYNIVVNFADRTVEYDF